jgi:hypothetical protein
MVKQGYVYNICGESAEDPAKKAPCGILVAATHEPPTGALTDLP